MYDELIKRLRRCQQFKCRECEYEQVMGCRAILNEEAADAIEELARRNEQFMYTPPPAWISVKERLPKMHQWVLVASKLVKIRMDFISSDGHWYTTSGVTHWMPLPEPPEGES